MSTKYPTRTMPHCDELCLHMPQICTICDDFPELQQARIDNRVNFTGEFSPNKQPCPSTMRRSLQTINRWPGNRPVAPERTQKSDAAN